MEAFAIHSIARRPAPDEEIVTIPAGAVFDAPRDELVALANEGAVRPATAVDKARHAEAVAAQQAEHPEVDPLALQFPEEQSRGKTEAFPEEAEDRLDGMTKAQLLAEVENRNQQRKEAGEALIDVESDANKAALLAALRAASSDAPAD